jgi:hypothetical protein
MKIFFSGTPAAPYPWAEDHLKDPSVMISYWEFLTKERLCTKRFTPHLKNRRQHAKRNQS